MNATDTPVRAVPQPGDPARRAEPGDDSIVTLLGELVSQGSHLAEQQISLMKAEVRESASDLKVAVGAMLGAAVVGIAALGVVLMALAYLLADVIDNLGLATLIVGVATLIIAFIMYRSAASKMSATHLAPERSQRTLQRHPRRRSRRSLKGLTMADTRTEDPARNRS